VGPRGGATGKGGLARIVRRSLDGPTAIALAASTCERRCAIALMHTSRAALYRSLQR
jgi:hypothetical protein